MSDMQGPLDWYYYRQQAIGYQKRLQEVEAEIARMWTHALDATGERNQRAAYQVHFSNPQTPNGFTYSNLVGERTRLLAQITAATSMSMMLYQQMTKGQTT
jgi:hypothetical protein